MPGQRADDVGGQTIREIVVGGIAGQVRKRGNRDDRPFMRLLQPRVARLVARHIRDEVKTSAMHGPDLRLPLAIIANRLPNRFYATRQCRVRNDPAIPDLSIDFFFCQDPAPIRNKIGEQIEHPGFDRKRPPVPSQFTPVRVELAIAESINHGRPRKMQETCPSTEH